jgi:hypothetical protein
MRADFRFSETAIVAGKYKRRSTPAGDGELF